MFEAHALDHTFRVQCLIDFLNGESEFSLNRLSVRMIESVFHQSPAQLNVNSHRKVARTSNNHFS